MVATSTAVFTILMVHLGTLATAATPTPAHPPDPEMLHYLEQLFQDAKRLNRPLVKGELNLMPRGKDGFANTIRCFFDTNPSSASDDSRILKFNLSSLSSSDKIASIQLVLKQSSNSTTSYRIQLHEIIGGESRKEINLLDSGEYSGQWHTLQVQNVQDSKDHYNGNRNYHLALTMTTEDGVSIGMGEILRIVNPMLLVYTNDVDWLGRRAARRKEENEEEEEEEEEGSSFREGSQLTKKGRSRRSIASASSTTANMATLTLDEKKQLSCRKHATPPSFDLSPIWPGELYIVLSPAKLNFSFCHGTCNDPLNASLADQYNAHAMLMALAAPELANAGVSPCCVPHEMTTIPMTFQSKISEAISMTSYPDVVSCRCM